MQPTGTGVRVSRAHDPYDPERRTGVRDETDRSGAAEKRENMEDKKQVVKEAVGHLLDHLSQVNVELGYSHKHGEDSDVNQQ